jgi:hypothetical protein
MQLHVTSSFFTSSPQNCTGVFNAAEEAEVCSGPENYGRNPDPSRVRCIRRPVPYPPYGGREDNIFWRRIAEAGERQLEAAGARSLGVKDALPLGEDIVHSVTNPTSKFTAAIHVYGGDLFAAHRSEWDPETLSEQRFDGERARQIFEEANRRFVAGLG